MRDAAVGLALTIAGLAAPVPGAAQETGARAVAVPAAEDTGVISVADPAAAGAAPSAASEALRRAAERAAGLRIVVSLAERRLWLRDGATTLHTAPVGVGKGTTLEHGGRTWTFDTPVGRRRVRAKAEQPVWVPPDWHYAELAQQRGFTLVALIRGVDAPLGDGARLRVRGDAVVHVDSTGAETALPHDEELVFGDTLFVPPVGTINRRIVGELGAYKLDLGDGYLLHGTRDAASVGGASTHGCLRLRADDLEFLFRVVPAGTPVYIY